MQHDINKMTLAAMLGHTFRAFPGKDELTVQEESNLWNPAFNTAKEQENKADLESEAL